MRSKAVLVVLASGLLGLLAVACEEGNTIVNTPGSTTTGISVTGTGEVFGTPDIALLSLGVQAQAANVADAREAAASRAKAVIDSLKASGIAEKDIQTTQFSIQPQYDFRNGTQSIRGYQVTNVLSVKVRKIDTTGKVLDDAVAAAGDTTVARGITFTIDDPTKLQESARTAAIEEARTKAEQIAKDAGVKLGKPVSISEGSVAIPYAAEGALAAPRTGDTSTPVETGELRVSISVTVLYSIE